MRKRIGVFMAQPDASFQSQLLCGINREAFAADCDVLLFAAAAKNFKGSAFCRAEAEIYRLANFDVLDGVIILPDVLQMEGVKEYLQEQLAHYAGPAVVINDTWDGCDSVWENSEKNYDELIDHLVLVHNISDVAVMLGQKDNPMSLHRLEAIRRSLEKHEITLSSDRLYYGNFWFDSGKTVAAQLLARPTLPQAVLCLSDPMAIGLKDALVEKGIRVPENIIITGFDSENTPASVAHQVTSIRLNDIALGRQAVRKLLGMSLLQSWQLKGALVLSKTCGCPSNVPMHMTDQHPPVKSPYDDDDGYYSGYNFMAEELVSSVDLHDVLWKIHWNRHWLGEMSGFALCLNGTFAEIAQGKEITIPCTSYSDMMYLMICTQEQKQVLETRAFERKKMLPCLTREQSKPKCYYFAPVHFNENIFGYTVMSSDSEQWTVSNVSGQWVRTCAIALESCMRLHNQKMLYRKFEESTTKDYATGLLSRNAYNIYAPQLLKKAISYECQFFFMIGDLNCLKYINDEFGHVMGDEAIRLAAGIFADGFACEYLYEDRVFRIGGDEFVHIVIGKITENDIKQHIAGIHSKLERLNQSGRLPFPVLLGLGYQCMVPGNWGNVEAQLDAIFTEADKKLYADKKQVKEESGFSFTREQ